MNSLTTRTVIAVDIDDVLFPFVDGIAEYHNSRKGTNLTVDDFFSYNFADVWGGDVAETEETVQAFLGLNHLHLQPVDGAKEALTRLSQDFDVVLVTARNQVFEEETATWLHHHLPALFSHVIFAGNPHDGLPFRPKGIICQELGARLLIDDHPTNLLSAVEHGIEGILFGTKAWSVQPEASTNITACADWDAVLEYIYNDWR